MLFADSPENAAYQEQKGLLENYKTDILERDLVVFEVFEGSGSIPNEALSLKDANDFRTHFDIQEGFTVILIGKDGTVKRRKNAVVQSEDLSCFAKVLRETQCF